MVLVKLVFFLISCSFCAAFMSRLTPRAILKTQRNLTAKEYIQILEADKAVATEREVAAINREGVLQKEKQELKDKLQKAEQDYVLLSAQFVGQRNLRPLVEIMLRQCFPNESLTASEASAKVTKKFFVNPDSQSPQLKPEWIAVLHDIEEGVNPKDVARELKDFFHELSKMVHYSAVRGKHGFLLSGELPLRAAAALMILQMQRMQPNNGKIPVIYCDALHESKIELINGEYYNIGSSRSEDAEGTTNAEEAKMEK